MTDYVRTETRTDVPARVPEQVRTRVRALLQDFSPSLRADLYNHFFPETRWLNLSRRELQHVCAFLELRCLASLRMTCMKAHVRLTYPAMAYSLTSWCESDVTQFSPSPWENLNVLCIRDSFTCSHPLPLHNLRRVRELVLDISEWTPERFKPLEPLLTQLTSLNISLASRVLPAAFLRRVTTLELCDDNSMCIFDDLEEDEFPSRIRELKCHTDDICPDFPQNRFNGTLLACKTFISQLHCPEVLHLRSSSIIDAEHFPKLTTVRQFGDARTLSNTAWLIGTLRALEQIDIQVGSGLEWTVPGPDKLPALQRLSAHHGATIRWTLWTIARVRFEDTSSDEYSCHWTRVHPVQSDGKRPSRADVAWLLRAEPLTLSETAHGISPETLLETPKTSPEPTSRTYSLTALTTSLRTRILEEVRPVSASPYWVTALPTDLWRHTARLLGPGEIVQLHRVSRVMRLAVTLETCQIELWISGPNLSRITPPFMRQSPLETLRLTNSTSPQVRADELPVLGKEEARWFPHLRYVSMTLHQLKARAGSWREFLKSLPALQTLRVEYNNPERGASRDDIREESVVERAKSDHTWEPFADIITSLRVDQANMCFGTPVRITPLHGLRKLHCTIVELPPGVNELPETLTELQCRILPADVVGKSLQILSVRSLRVIHACRFPNLRELTLWGEYEYELVGCFEYLESICLEGTLKSLVRENVPRLETLQARERPDCIRGWGVWRW